MSTYKKLSYKLQVNLSDTTCPVCHKKGLTIKENGELLCECGYVYRTSYNYVAGVRINTELDFKVNKITKKNNMS